jgi:CheY-like chemotaxis protein
VEFAALDLRELVADLGELLSAARSKKVALGYDFEPDLPAVEADAGQIRQVVLNLITNASEAIGGGSGEIRVTAAAAECDRAALVEPFFSTKFAGRGLGLAAVLGIVRGHGGAIRVESQLGRGTTITLLLPALVSRPTPVKTAPEIPEAWAGSGTILLIDDEEDAREVGSLVLQRVGFETVTAGDGERGLELFRSRAEDVVCVLLDLTMPRLDGVETHRMLRKLSADVPVILCSGYPEREAVERFAELGLAGFVQKPYTPDELVLCVQRVLATRPEF